MWITANKEQSTTTAKKMSAPTKRAVSYLKNTWRRVVRTPQKPVYNFNTSTPPLTPRTPATCRNRTQLDDIFDNDELTNIPSNVSRGDSSIYSSEQSPKIQDSDWRHFTDTGVVSSPSTFLGRWSNPPTSPNEEPKNEDSSLETTPFSIIDSAYIVGTTGELDIAGFYNSPNRPSTATGLRGPFSSSQISIATPTPAVRPRPASDPTMGSTTVADLEKLMTDIHMDDTPPLVPTLLCSAESSTIHHVEAQDKWSSISVCGGSTTRDLLNYDTPDLPASKRRKVSIMEPIRPSSPIDKEKMQQQHEQRLRPRDHPRFSGIYTVDPNRRIVNLFHGPAVFMPTETILLPTREVKMERRVLTHGSS